MNELLLSFLSVTLSMGIVTIALLALAPLFRKRFTAQWRYWVWLILALRLAVPFHFSGLRLTVNVPLPNVFAVLEAALPMTATDIETAVPMNEESRHGEVWMETAVKKVTLQEVSTQKTPVHPSPALVLTLLWLGGAAVFLAFQWGRYARLRRMVRRWGRPAGAEEYGALVEAMDRADMAAQVELIVCPMMSSPALAGWLRPVILLPEGFTGEALSFALLHELTHLKRYDLWYKAVLVWCNALHWFNPAVWLLRAQAEKDVEYACDEQALQGRDEGFRRSYGLAILSAASHRCPAAALTTHFTGSGERLRSRIGALLDTAPKRMGRTALTLVACAALLAGSMVACSPAEGKAADAGTQLKTPMDSALAAASASTVVEQVVEGDIAVKKVEMEAPVKEGMGAWAEFKEAMKAASIRENLRSLDDITDTMMTGETLIGFEAHRSSTNYLENGFVHSFGFYTGLMHQFVIHTDRAMEVELTYVTDFEEGAFQAAVITAGGEIYYLEHSREDKTVTLSLPEGENLVALAGYRAEGTFRIQVQPQEGVTFDLRDVWTI